MTVILFLCGYTYWDNRKFYRQFNLQSKYNRRMTSSTSSRFPFLA